MKNIHLLVVTLLFAQSVLAQKVDLSIKAEKITSLQTSVLMNEDTRPVTLAQLEQVWFNKKGITWAEANDVAGALTEPSQLFVVPIAEAVEKNVYNYELVLVQGKSTNVLPQAMTDEGFYLGKGSLNIIASIYVDPALVQTPFLVCYLSSLSNFIRGAGRFSTNEEMAAYLKKNFWSPEKRKVCFQEMDLDSTIRKNEVLSKVWNEAISYPDSAIVESLKAPLASAIYADIIEVKTKGGKSDIHRFFFSPTFGLIYHEFESSATRRDKLFTKRDVYTYGSADANGK